MGSGVRHGPWVQGPRGGTGPPGQCRARAPPPCPACSIPPHPPAAAVTGCGAARGDVGAGAGSSEMPFGRPRPRSPCVSTARWPKAAGRPNGGMAEARGAPTGARGVCSPARVLWRGPGVLPAGQFYLPMIKTHGRPPHCWLRGWHCRSPVPLPGPSQPGFGLAEPSTDPLTHPALHSCTSAGALWMTSLQAAG